MTQPMNSEGREKLIQEILDRARIGFLTPEYIADFIIARDQAKDKTIWTGEGEGEGCFKGESKTMTKGSDSAFPFHMQVRYKDGINDDIDFCGMTKRELFAAMAMQGILSNMRLKESGTFELFASDAVIAADCLLAELSKEGD